MMLLILLFQVYPLYFSGFHEKIEGLKTSLGRDAKTHTQDVKDGMYFCFEILFY